MFEYTDNPMRLGQSNNNFNASMLNHDQTKNWYKNSNIADAAVVDEVLAGFEVAPETIDSPRSQMIMQNIGSILNKMGALDEGRVITSEEMNTIKQLAENPLQAPLAYADEADALAEEWKPSSDSEFGVLGVSSFDTDRRSTRQARSSDSEIAGAAARAMRGSSDMPAAQELVFQPKATPKETPQAINELDVAAGEVVESTESALPQPVLMSAKTQQPKPSIIENAPLAAPKVESSQPAVLPLSSPARSGELVYSNDFSRLPAGTPDIAQAREYRTLLGDNLTYIKGFGAGDQRNGSADEAARERAGQINTASDQVRLSGENGALRVTYPQGGNTSSHSGVQFVDKIQGAPDEVVMSYKVKFNDDFPWQHGGKLPGVISKESFETREDLASTRLMWREDGKLEFYIHSPHDNRVRLLWDNGNDNLGHAAAQKDKWEDLSFRVKLNSVKDGVAQADGELEGWINGKHAGLYTDVKLRSSEDTNINTLFFSTFYGGSSGDGSTPWWPAADATADFDNIEVVAV